MEGGGCSSRQKDPASLVMGGAAVYGGVVEGCRLTESGPERRAGGRQRNVIFWESRPD